MHAQIEIETNPVIGLRAKNMEKHSVFVKQVILVTIVVIIQNEFRTGQH